MKTLKSALIILFTFYSLNLFSQEIPISIIERINQVDYIFEGKVIESNSYESSDNRNILTSNTIEIYKVFKGNITCGTIELICDDGQIGNKEQESSHTLNLKKGQIGVFLGNLSNKEISQIDFFNETNTETIEPTFENQSYIKYWYDGFNYQVSDLWSQYDSIAQFYSFTEQIIGYSYIDCHNSQLLQSSAIIKQKSTSSIAITSIFPLIVNGGIRDTLTIKGTDFGSVKGSGSVFFKNADDGGQSQVKCENDDFILWSDTLIQLYVPSRDTSTNDTINSNNYPAGSGTIRIVTNNSSEIISSQFVTINFSIANSSSKKMQLIATRDVFNQKYTFRCDTSVANYKNGLMKAVIKRALLDWRCLTGINWELGTDTFGISKGSDSICIITFDTLKKSTNAVTSNYPASCGGFSYYRERDIRINYLTKFFLDTISNEHNTDSIDFYHTILHELGHAHNFKHKIDTNSIMNYSSLSHREVDLKNDWGCDEGGNFIMDTSILVTIPCISVDAISTNYPTSGCDFSPTDIHQLLNTHSQTKVYPIPTENILRIEFDEKIIKDIKLYDINGKMLKQIHSNDLKIEFDVSSFYNGLYFITIESLNKISSLKFIKK